MTRPLTAIELCCGAGGQALGLSQAGFEHVLLVDNDKSACDTIRKNRPNWPVLQADIKAVDLTEFAGSVDLLAAGVPCPPFSFAGQQLGKDDERDLFPAFLAKVAILRPRAVMIENVNGLLSAKFEGYRNEIYAILGDLGYSTDGFRPINAVDFGVPQNRKRGVLIAVKTQENGGVNWPIPTSAIATVGGTLRALMASGGWEGADLWANQADAPAPTLVGGSKKHGGADLGPTRSRAAWAELGVNGSSLADLPPGPEHVGLPKLTIPMAALIQGFPADWEFAGGKTARYRQVGNAFPPPLALALGLSIVRALTKPR